MQVEVRRFATLADEATHSGTAQTIDLPDGADIFSLLDALGVPPADVHLVFVDGRVCADRNQPLRAGARVGLFPPIGGG